MLERDGASGAPEGSDSRVEPTGDACEFMLPTSRGTSEMRQVWSVLCILERSFAVVWISAGYKQGYELIHLGMVTNECVPDLSLDRGMQTDMSA